MINQRLDAHHKRLRSLIAQAPRASGEAGSFELESHWSKYICVLASGFLENAIHEIFATYADGKGSKPIVNFVERGLKQVNNPKTQRFIEITHAFSNKWGQDLQTFVADNGRKEAIDSIIAERNRIAHGDNSGISMSRITDYLDKSVEVIDFLENLTYHEPPH